MRRMAAVLIGTAIVCAGCAGPRAHLGPEAGASQKIFRQQVANPLPATAKPPVAGYDGATAELVWKKYQESLTKASGDAGDKALSSKSK